MNVKNKILLVMNRLGKRKRMEFLKIIESVIRIIGLLKRIILDDKQRGCHTSMHLIQCL